MERREYEEMFRRLFDPNRKLTEEDNRRLQDAIDRDGPAPWILSRQPGDVLH